MAAQSQYRFPPGPETNLLWSALRKLRPANPLNLFPHLAEKYGDAVHYQVGSTHFVLLGHPGYVREILAVRQENFVKERTMQHSRMLLGEGMITAEGALHRQQRQAAQPAFHLSGARQPNLGIMPQRYPHRVSLAPVILLTIKPYRPWAMDSTEAKAGMDDGRAFGSDALVCDPGWRLSNLLG